jgi:hypothetical protein
MERPWWEAPKSMETVRLTVNVHVNISAYAVSAGDVEGRIPEGDFIVLGTQDLTQLMPAKAETVG